MFSQDTLQACYSATPSDRVAEFFPALVDTMEHEEINTNHRIAAFLANVGIESNQLRTTRENLNYSVQGLRTTFRKYFGSDDEAAQYAHQPDKIANRVYGGRMGNGPEETGDGAKYKGRGLIQVTGKTNYAACGQALGLDLINDPDSLAVAPWAAQSAGWFWTSRNLNAKADLDFKKVCVAINGGLLGYPDRLALYTKTLNILGN